MPKHKEEVQSLSFSSISKESFKILFSWRKNTNLLTFLSIFSFSSMIFGLTLQFHYVILEITSGLDQTHDLKGVTYFSNSLALIFTHLKPFWLSHLEAFIFLSLSIFLATSTVVSTVGRIYSGEEYNSSAGKDTNFYRKGLKKFTLTFVQSLGAVLAYNIIALFLVLLWVSFFGVNFIIKIVIIELFLIIYLMGFAYIIVLSHLANVISVSEEEEDVHGFEAIMKSKALLKGNLVIALANVLLVFGCYVVIYGVFVKYVVLESCLFSLGVNIGIGIVCVFLVFIVLQFGIVFQTVLSFACKRSHNEEEEEEDIEECFLEDEHDLKGYSG